MERLITYKEALVEAQREEMERDDAVFVYGLDVPDHKRIFGSTATLPEKFGEERCFGTPLSEDSLMGFGLGAALAGMRPINVHIRVDFLLLAMNQLVNMVSQYHYATGGKLAVPLTIRAVIGRGWGQGMQHSKTLQSYFAHIPGLKVVMPTTAADAKGLTKSAIRDNNPVVSLEHRWLYDIKGHVPEDPDVTIPIGEPALVCAGDACTILATSWMIIEARKAADILAKQNVHLEILDPRTLSPLNYDPIVRSVNKTGNAIVADYDWLPCGYASEATAVLTEKCFGKLKGPITRIGFAFTPCPTTRPLENEFYPNAITIIRAVEKKLGLKKTDLSGERFYSYENKFKGPF